MYRPLILIACAATLCIALPILRTDEEGYRRLLKSSEPQKMRALCQQSRSGVTKRVWSEDAHLCAIDSDDSDLFFFTEKGEIEVVEELRDVACLFQERLYFRGDEAWQRVRFLKAKEASYHYNNELFTANNVKLWTYDLPGHTPPDSVESFTPSVEGRAESIELKLQGKAFDLEAHRFKGKMR